MRETRRREPTRTRTTRPPGLASETIAPAASDEHALRRIAALALEVRESLAESRRALETEVRLYPTPIPRCDAQFNHLYEQRGRVSALLAHVDDGLERGDAAALASACAAFIRLTDAARGPGRRLCERVESALAAVQGTTGR